MECGAEDETLERRVRGKSQGRELHYCTRRQDHGGDHLCPCGYHWAEAAA